MTENSTSQVGRSAIDAYLDSVEQALVAANAPRSDRVQVLQDLESQIDDMRAQQPAPVTEETIHAMLEKLEPASHFAATYGNGRQPRTASPSQSPARGIMAIRWSRVAMACLALPILGPLLEVALNAFLGIGNGAILHLSILAGLVATPGALAMAYWQLREYAGRFPDRDLVLSMTIGFAVVAPAFVMIVLTEWTYGLVLIPFGFLAVVYLQYELVRRIQRYMIDTLPPQDGDDLTSEAGRRAAASPLAEGPGLSHSWPAVQP